MRKKRAPAVPENSLVAQRKARFTEDATRRRKAEAVEHR